MNYKIDFDKKALKFIMKLPQDVKTRIFSAIKKLPFEGDIKTIKGYKGFYRLRVGDYRIIYTIDNDRLIVSVVDAGNRGQIYNRY